MTRTDESLGGAVSFARMSSADARFSRAKTAFMISRSRRVRRSVGGFGICDSCRILDATHVACQVRRRHLGLEGRVGLDGRSCALSFLQIPLLLERSAPPRSWRHLTLFQTTEEHLRFVPEEAGLRWTCALCSKTSPRHIEGFGA